MQPEARTFLEDVRQAAELLATFTRGKSLEGYTSDPMLSAAVEREFEIIGEALNRLRQAAPEVAAGIPKLEQIIAFRNILVHGYRAIDDRIVWSVVQQDLPTLRTAVRKLLASR
jgi:uncharacterized protein with HEPN domain